MLSPGFVKILRHLKAKQPEVVGRTAAWELYNSVWVLAFPPGHSKRWPSHISPWPSFLLHNDNQNSWTPAHDVILGSGLGKVPQVIAPRLASGDSLPSLV